jgi:hypothetical protein
MRPISLDLAEKRNFSLPLPGTNPRLPFRAARSLSLYRLSHPGPSAKVLFKVNYVRNFNVFRAEINPTCLLLYRFCGDPWKCHS